MAKLLEHKKALILRKKGLSYSQIMSQLNVSKSTLSGWLRNYPLSRATLEKLCYKNDKKIEKYRQTMLAKHNERLKNCYNNQKNKISSLDNREIFIAGLFLY